MNKSKASSSERSEAQKYLSLTDKEKAAATLDEIKKNTQNVLGDNSKIPEVFANIPKLLVDPTSPIMTDSETLAPTVTNVVPEPKTTPPVAPRRRQTKEDVRRLVMKCSSEIGVVLSQAHLDDLFHISSSSPVDERFVWAYVRGVSITNQISATTTMTKIVKDIESVMAKTQQYVAQGMDSNKLLSERITMHGQKLEQLVPSVGALMKAEHSITRDLIKNEVKKSHVAVATIGESSKKPVEVKESAPTKGPCPSAEDIENMCRMAEVPEEKIKGIASKYAGSVGWKEHNMVMSGAMSVQEARALIVSWKGRV